MKIVFVGLSGVPFSNRAADVRVGAFADLFVKCGYKVEIINRFSMIKNSEEKLYRIYEPFKSLSPSNKLTSSILYTIALIIEPLIILRSHVKERIDVLHVYSGHFADFLVYRLICWLIGAKLINQYCEARSSFEYRNLYHSINGFLVDRVSPKIWDGAICISHYLESCCKHVNRNVKTILVYPLCDFSFFDQCKTTHQVPAYFLLCASVAYREIIDFVLEAYRRSSVKEKIQLRLVLAGDAKVISMFKEQNPDVIIESKLPYIDLIKRYKEALALLIPLRNTIQDIARFPNKTCEYCAAKGVIITSNVGEMKYVFKDMENALVTTNYSIDEFIDKMDWIGSHPNEIDKIKEESYNTGLKYFSDEAYSQQLKSFIESITNKSI